MPEITLKHIKKQYQNADTPAVADYNLTIHDKEFIVFVGPSGSGKSTVLRMIAGLEDITSGDFEIDGERMNDVSPKDRGIAMVFQNYALYPHMSVFDNIAYGLKLRREKKDVIKQKVEAAAEVLGLSPYLERKPADLSGGQRQRVAMGRAIVRDAKLMLMDEPLSNLDAKLRVQMRAEIAKIHQRMGGTTIYVTHDQTEAMTLADRIVIIDQGDIQQVGTPEELYNQPVNTFVASFIGSPAMNMLPVTFADGHIFNDEGFKVQVPVGVDKVLRDKGYEGKEIIFGIRPENIYSEKIALDTYATSQFDIQVDISELHGADAMLYAKVGETDLVLRVGANDFVQPGTTLRVAANLNKGHFFDKETTQRIF
jgi:multiple sugar transport system ATP-binding protein